MTWAVDTIFNPVNSIQTTMTSLYVGSSNNIYIAGHNDGPDQIWHYDGVSWTPIDLWNVIGGYYVSGLFGVSERNIWVYGYRGYGPVGEEYNRFFVMKNDGSKWTPFDLDGYGRIITASGTDENNVLTAGDSGYVFKYNGSSWEKNRINISYSLGAFYTFVGSAFFNNKLHLLATIFGTAQGDKFYYINGSMNNWSIIDSMKELHYSSEIKWGTIGLYSSPYGKLYSFGAAGIWEWKDEKWIKIFDTNVVIRGMYGLSKNYMIAVGEYNMVYFYNGVNWTQLTKFKDGQGLNIYTAAWADGNEVIVLGHTLDGWPQKSVVWKGK